MMRTLSAGATQSPGAQSWAAIGEYLQSEPVRLLSAEKRAGLLSQWEDISRQEATLDDAILIGLVGGTGVGKSTFINALAGQEVSRSSDRRPTTDRVIVYRHVRTEISGDIPTADLAQPEVLHDNAAIEKVVLFDFPDFDSAEESHTSIIRRYLPYLDVLLVMVDDVKYADRRLYELLSRLDHDPQNIFVLLNKTDRLVDRYGAQAEEVKQDLLADLRQKLRDNSDLTLKPTQQFAIAARPVFEARERDEMTGEMAAFEAVEAVLESFQHEKHRRAAKERNLDARKRDLQQTLEGNALGEENRVVLEEAKVLVHRWQRELDTALAAISVEVLTDQERRGVRGARLRQVSPQWGIPFALLFTLIGEFRRRSATQVEPTELGHRVRQHYRGFFEAIQNLQARFASEFSDSQLNFDSAPREEAAAALARQLGQPLRDAVQASPPPVGVRRRTLAHVPAVGTFGLALWGKVHPVLESVTGTGEDGVLWAALMSLIGTLDPTFIIGTIVGTIFVYLLTAGVIWLREIQRVEHSITLAEQETREQVRDCGDQALNLLNEDLQQLYAEFERLTKLLQMS